MKQLVLWILLVLGLPLLIACVLYVLVLNAPWYLITMWRRGFDKATEPPDWVAWVFFWTRYLRLDDPPPDAMAGVAEDAKDAVGAAHTSADRSEPKVRPT